jgi:methyl-accepting chemotaxis protein
MDETTQQNAALVEEASAAARSLEEQAAQLADTVAVFRLEARPQLAAAPAVRAVAKAAPKPVRTPRPAKADAATALAESDWQEF